MRTKRVPVLQSMIASVGEKRKRPEGKMFKEPLVIPCTAEELNMSWTNGLEMELLGCLLCPGHQLRKKGRILCFARFITMSNTPPRTTGPSVGFSTRSLGREPWSSLKRSPEYKGTLYPIIREMGWWL